MPQVRAKATLIYDDSLHAWICRMPYIQEMLNDFRNRIPGGARVWKPAPDKYWVVDDLFISTVKELCDTYCDGYEEHRPSPSPTIIQEAVATHFKNFIGLCGKDALTRLYRQIAIEVHPDKCNGDNTKMSELNVNWDLIKKDMGW